MGFHVKPGNSYYLVIWGGRFFLLMVFLGFRMVVFPGIDMFPEGFITERNSTFFMKRFPYVFYGPVLP